MNRAAILMAIAAIATLNSNCAATAPAAASATVEKPAAAPATAPAMSAATAAAAAAAAEKAVVPAGQTVAQVVAQAPAVPSKPVLADTAKPSAVPGQPISRQDSVLAKRYKVAARNFSKEEAKYFQTVLNFKVKGKPESTLVNWMFRDHRGALLSYTKGKSEWAYSFDTVAYLDAKEYLPDSLIRTKTDGLLKDFLKERSANYAFVNHEKTMVQFRDTSKKEGVGPSVPAYYIGRYLRKLDGRYVLGDNFQVRIGVGRSYVPAFISFRDPVLADSSMKEKVPTREMVQEYLDKWAKDKRRLGNRTYPYHPDNLRIKALKPVKVFESYVLTEEKFRDMPGKDGVYLVPRVTVLAEAVLAKSQKRLKLPEPPEPVLLHFHFPCTPGAGLCWPDGKQGLEGGPQSGAGSQAPAPSQGTQGHAAPKPEIPAPAR